MSDERVKKWAEKIGEGDASSDGLLTKGGEKIVPRQS